MLARCAVPALSLPGVIRHARPFMGAVGNNHNKLSGMGGDNIDEGAFCDGHGEGRCAVWYHAGGSV